MNETGRWRSYTWFAITRDSCRRTAPQPMAEGPSIGLPQKEA